MMHKEIVGRRKAPVIALVLLLITVMLYVHEGLNRIDFDSKMNLLLCNMVILILTILIIVREFMSCKISYKYAIIANKLIVNKIFNKSEKNLLSVKISEIVYIGKKCDKLKEFNAKSEGSFICDILNSNNYYCVYKKADKYYKFAFRPSKSFIDRINKKLA